MPTPKPASQAPHRTANRTPKPPRILIITMSAGSGHVSAAQALAEALQSRSPRAQVVVADHAKLLGKHRGQAVIKGYQMLTTYFPRLWQAFYSLADFDFPPLICQKLRQLFSRAGESSLINFVLRGRFDYVICTHFAAAHIIAALKTANKLRLHLAVVITDFGLHHIWLAGSQVDHYFVASDQTKKQLCAAGVAARQIVTTGIPVQRQFQTARSHQRQATNHPLRLLIVETRTNAQPLLSLLRKLRFLQDRLQLTIVGLTKTNLTSIKKFLAQANWHAGCHGFVDNMAHHFAANDIVITKSGGLTTAEAMACRIPPLVLRPIPGQEMTNLSALLTAGAGLYAADEDAAQDAILSLIRQPQKLHRLQKATRKLAKPKAALTIAKFVLAESKKH